MLSGVAVVAFYILAGILVARASRGRFLGHFPFFYSYILFMITSGAALLVLYFKGVPYYPTAAWLRLLMSLLAEFAVLVEISDHIFNPYPAIRRLGRALTILVGSVLFGVYISPLFFEHQPSDLALLDLTKRISLTKAVIIVVLLAAIRYYRLSLGRNISGMILGYMLYLAINLSSFAAAQHFGRSLYASVLNIFFLISYDLCLLVWVVALWRYELAPTAARRLSPRRERLPEPLGDQLGRFNATLTKLLEK